MDVQQACCTQDYSNALAAVLRCVSVVHVVMRFVMMRVCGDACMW